MSEKTWNVVVEGRPANIKAWLSENSWRVIWGFVELLRPFHFLLLLSTVQHSLLPFHSSCDHQTTMSQLEHP